MFRPEAVATGSDYPPKLPKPLFNSSARYFERLAQAFEANGELAREIPGFSVREGQRALAHRIGQAIAAGEALIAEAGTGTGKTFAYLVPALLSGGPVVISTGTRNLQDQLFHRDLPRVRAALGVNLRVALLKGRANYVCRHHLRRNLQEGRFDRREDIAVLHRIDRFASVSVSGDRSEAPGIAEDHPVWAKAVSSRENCLGQDCADFAECFVFKARQAAQQADVLVVNHHLFCADLALRDEGVADLLPSARAVVFDEAHQLPDVATQFFGSTVSSRQLIELARDILRVGHADARDSADWMEHSRRLELAVRDWRAAADRPGRHEAQSLVRQSMLTQALGQLQTCLVDVHAVLSRAAERSRDLARLAQRVETLNDFLGRWLEGLYKLAVPARGLNSDEAPHEILWAEHHTAGVALHSSPLSVAEPFQRHQQAHSTSWIFVSATLSVDGSFEHFKRSLGLEQASAQQWESPFNYEQQSALWLATECGDPAASGFGHRIAEVIWPLLRQNGGRAFLLCTSLRMVTELATQIAEYAHREPQWSLEILVQGQGSRSELLERFRAARAPVLIGSASFWEGVDVVGDQLSMVVIDKLPFAPPDDPLLKARIEACRRTGEDAFGLIQLPAAAMALKQGAGRLIRSETDRGLLIICDARLRTRGYGRKLLRSLPPFAMLDSQNQALAWLEARDARSGAHTG